jgi:uracil-DNA glycosylase family 4
MFTGDQSGAWLMRAMHGADFASLPSSERGDDGLRLTDAYITAAARCAPPDNKPTLDELERCRPYLLRERALLTRVRVIVALGRIGFMAVLAMERSRGATLPRPVPKFGHGAEARIGAITVIASYHPSQQNTLTGKLTAPMLAAIFRRARELIDQKRRPARGHRRRIRPGGGGPTRRGGARRRATATGG